MVRRMLKKNWDAGMKRLRLQFRASGSETEKKELRKLMKIWKSKR